jgi:hypothetical protein
VRYDPGAVLVASGPPSRVRRVGGATARPATVSSAAVGQILRLTLFSGLAALSLTAAPAAAADLQPRTAQAFDKYAGEMTRDFVSRATMNSTTARRCDGVITARAGNGDGILNVPDGLTHHWLGLAFVRGASLKDVEQVARDYSAYPKVYKSVVSTKVLSRQGDTYRVLIRLKEDAGLTAVLDVRSAVEYRMQRDGSITAISKSEEIRQVDNFGKRNESLLPAGRDSGYLWRAHTLTHFVAEKDGVFIVMETLGLSRQFPPLTGWIIEPIARRIGRKSVEGSLDEFLNAIRRSAGLPAPKSPCA